MTSKHIYIYSPSGAVRDKAAFKRGVARLQALGHEVEVDRDALNSFQRFAGDDASRLAAIGRACASGADVALISRGGYGLTRILPNIRYQAVAQAIAKGTQFIGLSDFTAFAHALLAKTGAISWAGPALCEGFGGSAPPDEIMQACFTDLLSGRGQGTGWRQNRSSPNLVGLDKAPPTQIELQNRVLWGGNLTLLTSLLGTPFWPNVRAGILFLEEVGEHPYRCERMLSQLLHAGVLAQQKAIVLGQFTQYKLVGHDRGFKIQSVIDWLRQKVKTPILTNLPFGHVPTKVLLPIGAKVDLTVNARDVMMLWGHS